MHGDGPTINSAENSRGPVVQARDIDKVEIHHHAAPHAMTPRRVVGVLPPRADGYQSRAELTISGSRVLSGLGGVGKTQLAAEHARTLWDRNEIDLLVWVEATSREAIVSTYARATGPDPDAEQAAVRWLESLASTDQRWLVVLDDIQDPADLRGLWPPHTAAGQLVVTTRRRDSALRADRRPIVDIGLFAPSEAAAFLTHRLSQRQIDDAPVLAETLGYLPLALAQAAAYIADHPALTCGTYLTKFTDRRTTLARVLPDLSGLPDEHRATIATTWSLSIEAAGRLTPTGLAGPLLNLAAMLDPNGIPETVFTTPAALSHLEIDDPELAVEGLSCLHRLSLITHTPDTPHQAVRVHALVQRAVRETLTPQQLSALASTAADALLQAWPEVERDTDLVAVLRSNTGILTATAGELVGQPDGHDVLLRAGASLGQAGQLAAAVDYLRDLATTTDRLLGPSHTYTLATRSTLAYWHGQTGDPAGAGSTLDDLLTDYLRILGPDHTQTLNTRQQLAYWRGFAGDPAGAATDLEALLTDYLRILGPDHPDTLTTRGNLARWRGQAGDPAGAATAFEELLADRLRILSADHPHVLNTRHHLAHWRGEAGDPVSAAADLEDLLVDYLRILGPDHPDTLITRSNLAKWRGEMSDPAGAATAFEALLADQLRILGPDHPDTLITRGNVARWRGRAGDPAEAATTLEALLTDRLRIMGPDHPDTLITRGNLAKWRGDAGDPAGATTAFEALLADHLRVLGPDHPDTLNTRHNIAKCRGQAGDPAGAAAALAALLPDHLRVLGPDHPSTLRIRHNLAQWRGEAGNPAEAATAFEALLPDRLRVLGPDHPDTLSTRSEREHWKGIAARGGSPAVTD